MAHVSPHRPSGDYFDRDQRKCNDFKKTQDPSCRSFESMQQMHKAKAKSCERRADWLFYLIQFHSLRLEAAHVDGKVVVLLLQQLHPNKHKTLPISMCLQESFSRMPGDCDACGPAGCWLASGGASAFSDMQLFSLNMQPCLRSPTESSLYFQSRQTLKLKRVKYLEKKLFWAAECLAARQNHTNADLFLFLILC